MNKDAPTTQAALSEENQVVWDREVGGIPLYTNEDGHRLRFISEQAINRLLDAARAEGHKTGYREGWNDRECDLIAGVERITGRAEGRPTPEVGEAIREAICTHALGYRYADLMASKREWIDLRGEKNGYARDINDPFQSDVDDAVAAILALSLAVKGGVDPEIERLRGCLERLRGRAGVETSGDWRLVTASNHIGLAGDVVRACTAALETPASRVLAALPPPPKEGGAG